jgi:H+/gluconate symporter-like permease
MLANLGLLAGLALLIVMALRGVNILLASLLCSLVVVLTNEIAIAKAFAEHYPAGPLGAFTFAGRFFILFLCGAVFGRMMAASQAASAIALAITRGLGVKRVLLVTMLAAALLTYGGVVVFVVIFTLYPLGIALMREANLPKRIYCAAASVGAGTFTMTALPGSPSIHNVIAASALGTDLFAGAWIGLLGAALMAGLGIWYVEREWRLARAAGEGYESNAQDERMAALAGQADRAPSWQLASLPLAVVLATIILPRLLLALDLAPPADTRLGALVAFSQAQPILWPSFALVLGTLTAIALFPSLRSGTFGLLGKGAEDSIMPLINTAAVIGFGGVVVQTPGFAAFSQGVLALDLPPLLSVFASVSVVAGITGSASGGLQIFMQTLAPKYLEMGVEPETLHRIATMASGGIDSLPHCGAVIATLMIMGLSHREAYRNILVVTVAIPVIATLVCIGMLGLFG